jgi:F-type H+-transporting ATPase subunit b
VFLFANLEHSNWIAVLLAPQSNVINWLVLLVVLACLGAKYLPPTLQARKETIESELQAAAQAREQASKQLEEQKRKVAAADKEADQILVEAKQAAEQMRIEIEKQTESDVAELLKKFEMAMANERQLAISEMRAVAIRAAIKLAEENLRSAMTEEARAKLLTQFVEQLDSISDGQQVSSPEQFERIH